MLRKPPGPATSPTQPPLQDHDTGFAGQSFAEATGLAGVLEAPFPAEQQTDLWLRFGSIFAQMVTVRQRKQQLLPCLSICNVFY